MVETLTGEIAYTIYCVAKLASCGGILAASLHGFEPSPDDFARTAPDCSCIFYESIIVYMHNPSLNFLSWGSHVVIVALLQSVV